ncbi:hypothetical protein D030_3770A, partial [Vibrio parahaemolyticus AQ3810]
MFFYFWTNVKRTNDSA